MRAPDVRRIQKEDFAQEERPLVEKLAFPINSFMEQTKAVLDKGVDFTNLNQQIVEVDITVNANGIPTTDTKFKVSLKSKVAGCICINAQNLVNTNQFPTSQPFITFVQNGSILDIRHCSGLQAGVKYRLRLIAIGF